MGLKSAAKPGKAEGNLKVSGFKKTRKVYLVTGIESHPSCWLELLNPSHAAVQAYVERDKRGYDGQDFPSFCFLAVSLEATFTYLYNPRAMQNLCSTPL